MRSAGLFLAAFTLVSAAAIAAARAQSPSPAPSPATAAELQAEDSGYVLKVKTRLVTIDIVATDARGNIVRDLKPSDLQVYTEHNVRQTISHFEFKSPSDVPASAATLAVSSGVAKSPKVYSNQVEFQNLKIAPTVILLDALNTTLENQISARLGMLRMLKTLPSDTPVAVFLLSHRLHLVQGLTSDPALLRTAVNKLPEPVNPGYDPTAVSTTTQDVATSELDNQTDVLNQQDQQEITADLENFMKEEYARTIDLRATLTLETLTSIARSLSGIPGRKNLVWVSESFPLSIAPDLDSQANGFSGMRTYSTRVAAAANALSDAQVTVYPVDARGLETLKAFDASQGFSAQASLNSRLAADQLARWDSQATMHQIAEQTGGSVCENTNNLSGCVQSELNHGLAYYELNFYPENVKWDAQFHTVVLKSTRPGLHLTYRRGFYAGSGTVPKKGERPDAPLRDACADFLPATAIHLVAESAPLPSSASSSPGEPDQLRYLLRIAPGALTLQPKAEDWKVNVLAAVCTFDAKGDQFRLFTQDLSGTLSQSVLRKWQADGMPDAITVEQDPALRRIRLAVLDVPTGLVGAVDIPVPPLSPERIAVLTPPKLLSTPVVEIPDRGARDSRSSAMDTLTVRNSATLRGILDWSADSLRYRGELSKEDGAFEFFAYAFGGRFRCQEGSLAPISPSTGQPRLQMTFRDNQGRSAVIDLKGTEPQYSGALPVDPGAKEFFAALWKLAHCVPAVAPASNP